VEESSERIIERTDADSEENPVYSVTELGRQYNKSDNDDDSAFSAGVLERKERYGGLSRASGIA
jgi:hypothetical protein